jgi:heat shock protein HtpX
MAGGGLAEYERAYKEVKGKGGMVPASALAAAGTVSLRAPSTEAQPVEPATERIERARETSDLMWRLNKYKEINCECGTRLRVPPNYRQPVVRCPHCGRIHQI